MPEPEQDPSGAGGTGAPSQWEFLASSVLVALLEEGATGQAAMSTARLRKLLDLRQSTLARVLARLEEMGLVALDPREDGSTVTRLTVAGQELLADRPT